MPKISVHLKLGKIQNPFRLLIFYVLTLQNKECALFGLLKSGAYHKHVHTSRGYLTSGHVGGVRNSRESVLCGRPETGGPRFAVMMPLLWVRSCNTKVVKLWLNLNHMASECISLFLILRLRRAW